MLAPALDLARETFRALLDLALALPRHILAFALRTRRLGEFNGLSSASARLAEPGPAPRQPLRRILLSCGDASGETHALALVKALRDRNPGMEVAGFGGSRLRKAGMEVWEPLADLNVMGFADVASRLPLFLRSVFRFSRELRDHPPDAVVLVDYPGLNRHLLRITARTGVPIVDHIAPQLWAWAPWRISDFRRADRLTTILPFEQEWFSSRGARTLFVGHPLGDQLAHAAAGESPPPAALRENRTWVGLLPGSRRREIRDNLPAMLEAASLIKKKHPDWGFVLPHLKPEALAQARGEWLADPPDWLVQAPGCWHSVLPSLTAAWVASGTAVLEAAAHGVAPVVVYRIPSRLGSWLAAHALAVPHVAALNLMAGQRLVPEHVGRTLNPVALASDLEALVSGPRRVEFDEKMHALLPFFAEPGAAVQAASIVEKAAGAV
jgi:lipid-A-disaccharide synthase